jgi:putative oxidoreductase
MERFTDHTYALMRIVAGLLFLSHGMQKLFGFPAPMQMELPAFITYGAGPIELIGGLLIMLGLFGRWAAFVCSGQMAVAYWVAHGTNGLFPLLNGGEMAALYCFVFLAIAARGSGIWSIDAAMKPAT